MQIFSIEGLVSIYALVIGILMLGWWPVFLIKGKVPELKDRPWTIYTHVAAEVLTGLVLIASFLGIFIFTWGEAPLLIGLGMLLYTSINSSGYYIHSKEAPMVVIFISLTILTTASILALI